MKRKRIAFKNVVWSPCSGSLQGIDRSVWQTDADRRSLFCCRECGLEVEPVTIRLGHTYKSGSEIIAAEHDRVASIIEKENRDA